MPALSAHIAQANDPYLRDARSILDAVKARVPGLSDEAALRRDVWGEPVKRGNSVGPDLISPVYVTAIDKRPLSQEIARLGVPLTMPKRSIFPCCNF